jgi:PAP2 superfamily protein
MAAVRSRREVAIGLGVYAAALAVRKAVWSPAGHRRARENTERLFRLERRLGIALEPRLQAAALRFRRPLGVVNAAYVAGNVVVTIGSLALLLRRGDPRYRVQRRAVAGAMLAAQAPFLLFPTAPPRRLDDFVDTMAEVSGVTLEKGLVSQLFNPLAAMPSIHMAWAVVSAETLRACSGSPAVRAAAAAYPPAVGAMVVVTANHLIADIVAGAALGHAALRASRRYAHSSG